MRHIRSILYMATTAALIALVGCSHGSASSSSTTSASDTANANATADADATATSPDGTGSTTTASVDTSKLGAPIYPGAAVNDASTAVAQNEMGSSAVLLKTTDTFDQVITFYEQKLPAKSERMKMEAAGGSLASFQFISSDGSTGTQVTITGKAGETAILIATAPVKK